MKKYKIIKSLTAIIICITAIIVFSNVVSEAETAENEELNGELSSELNEEEISDINKKTMQIATDMVKQASDDPYEDKPYSDEYLKWLNSSDEEKAQYGDIIPPKEFIAIHNKITEEDDQSDTENISAIKATTAINASVSANVSASANTTASVTDSYYKIPNLIVEDQGDSGWCYAYSSLKSLQTYLQKNKGIKAANYNFAEYHLAYMRFKTFGGWRDGPEKGDYSSYGEAAYYNTPGNFTDFLKYTGVYEPSTYSTKGPILGQDTENKIYFFNDDTVKSFQDKSKSPEVKVKKVIRFSQISKEYSGTKVTYKNGDRTLTDSEIQAFRNAVKSHILNNGGISTAINRYTSAKDYFNESTNALYINNNNINTNHLVTIVGWDDKYSKNNFKSGEQPNKDGAWIALNSYGDDEDAEIDGQKGYFYISYDDALVEQYMYGVADADFADVEPTTSVKYTKNDNNTVTVTVTSTDKISNVEIWKSGTWQKTTDWKVSYVGTETSTYYTAYTKKTTLTKTYSANTTEYIRVQDELGNYQDGFAIITVSGIDETGPTISSVTGYKNNTWVNSNVKLTVSASDSSGLNQSAYSFDGGKTWQSSSTKEYSATTSGISIVVRDKWGNTTQYSETINLKIDKEAPTFTVVGNEGIDGTRWVNPITKQTSHIRFDVTDTGGSGVAYGYEYSTDNKNWKSSTTKDSLNSYFNYWFTKNETLYFRIKDNAGNYSASTKVLINMVDTQAPTINSVKQALSTDKSSLTLTVTATDTQSGLAQYSFDGGSSWQKGNQYKYEANQTVKAGTIQVKDTAGNIAVYNTAITISGIDTTELKIVSETYSPSLQNITNKNVTAKIVLNKNVKSPTQDSGWVLSSDGKTLTKEFSTNTAQTGEKLEITDSNTGKKITKTITVLNIDKDAPKIVGNITKNSDTKYVKSVTVTIPKIEDVGVSGLSNSPYSYDSGKTWVSSNTNTYTSNGTMPIWIRDNVGNILKTSVNIDNTDTEAPQITSVTGYTNNKWVNSNVTIEVNASDDKALADTAYSFDGGKTWQQSYKKSYSNTTSGIVIVVRDKAGWQTQYNNGEKINLKIDKVVPTITTNSSVGIETWAKDR